MPSMSELNAHHLLRQLQRLLEIAGLYSLQRFHYPATDPRHMNAQQSSDAFLTSLRLWTRDINQRYLGTALKQDKGAFYAEVITGLKLAIAMEDSFGEKAWLEDCLPLLSHYLEHADNLAETLRRDPDGAFHLAMALGGDA